ncbi:MAG: hypothetical protein K8S97_11905 [Anaerolineae bacterium]|nr:hypothetical protein [Anaerolineae bacterium]
MTSEQRANLVALIWIMMSVVCIVAVANGELGLGLLIPLLVAILATFFLGVLPGMLTTALETREKAKRTPQDRMSLLMEMMDDDERAAFKAALKQRVLDDLDRAEDGELPLGDTTLAALIGDDGTTRSKRRS